MRVTVFNFDQPQIIKQHIKIKMEPTSSSDILLDGTYRVHLAIVPKLGLVIINELGDFGENWLEIKVVENSRFNLQYDVRLLTGCQDEEAVQAAGRYFVEVIHSNLHEKSGPTFEQVGSLFKFMLNINLRPEILNNRKLVTSLGNALHRLM